MDLSNFGNDFSAIAGDNRSVDRLVLQDMEEDDTVVQYGCSRRSRLVSPRVPAKQGNDNAENQLPSLL